MGKASRRNRTRTPRAAPADTSDYGAWQPGPTPGYDVNGIALPPGCPGSLFDVHKIDPRPGVNGGAYQFVVLPNEPHGKILSECLAQEDWDLYAFAARMALGDEYDKMYKAVHEFDRAVADGMTDSNAIDARVRAYAGLAEPISLLDGQ